MGLFSKKTQKKKEAFYLLMDRNSRMLARGTRKVDDSGEVITITLIEGDPSAVRCAEIIQAVPQDKSLPPQMTRIVGFKNDAVLLEPMRDLSSEVRRNFRIPVAFDSFIYPSTGGRAVMHSVDLSCGGVAFRSPATLSVGNLFQVVIPITREAPLLMDAEILRVHLENQDGNFYACKFIDMIDEQESMLREAVFATQLSARARKN